MSESFTVNSEITKQAFKAQVDRWFSDHKYLTFSKPRFGVDRSIDQNSLFHVWLTEFAAHLASCSKKDVTKGMLAGIKRRMKKLYHCETQADFMIHIVECPLTGETKKDYTSSKNWKTGEMFDVLNWLQMFAAQHGCILESKGEHQKLTRKQNAA